MRVALEQNRPRTPSTRRMATMSNGTPRTLLVNLVGHGYGGLETHVLNLHKQLAVGGYRPLLLVAARSAFQKRVAREGLCHVALWWYRMPGFHHLFPYVFNRLCFKHDIRAIHCNNRFEVPGALHAARRCSARVVFNYHVAAPFDAGILKGIDAFVSPNQQIVQMVQEQNRVQSLQIKQVCVIPPLFDAERFLGYRSDESQSNWFADNFNINLKPCPVICSIGNMVSDLEHKNYPLLFQAMAHLIHEKRTLVQAVLVGDGPVRPFLEQLGRTLKINDYLHFVGYSCEHTPGVLHHSNAFVLASSKEAFGIVYLEAGLMRKPAIGARETGAEHIILHNETGLLFENGDAKSLSAAIERIVGDPIWASRLGGRAFDHVMHHFSPSVVVKQYEGLYEPA